MRKFKKFLLIITLLLTSVLGIGTNHVEAQVAPDPTLVLGCMDAVATNYNPAATQDDGSCTYPPAEPVLGCMDETATNYNPAATQDDSSCTYPPAEPTIPDPVSVHLTVTTNSGNLYNNNITVSACDSDNPASGNLKVTAYCAVLQSGLTSDWNTAWAPGIFLNSINNISGFVTQNTNGFDVYHYWSWGTNGADAMVGMNQYTLQAGDQVYLTFIDPQTEAETEEQVQHFHSSGGSSKKVEKEIFDYKKALEYLASQQKADSTFGAELYTDWAGIAFGSDTSSNFSEQKEKLIKYYSENKLSDNASLTDLERHAFALMSLNLNPYNTNSINYIAKIISHYDSKTEQFGDANLDNDDIFAILVLQNAGFDLKDTQIAKSIDFVLSQQKADGSWDNNADITSAGIQALVKFNESPKVKTTLENARKYLTENQKEDASWAENVSSTAWAANSILALNEKIEDWTKNGNNPLNYLSENQETDGSVKISETENLDSKIWETSYAAIAASGKSWNQIIHQFEKQKIEIIQNPVNSNPNRNSETKVYTAKPTQNTTALQTEQPETNIAQDLAQTEKPAHTNWFRKVLNLVKNIFS